MAKNNRFSSYSKNTYAHAKKRLSSIEWTPYVVFHTIYHTFSNILFFFLIVSILLIALLAGFGTGYFAALVKDQPVESDAALKKALNQMAESTTVYFGTGQSLGSLNADTQRQVVNYQQINPHVVDALVATEDEYFYKHNGIVPKAFIRASAQEILGSSTSSGGSTLTQQLIKNQLLSNETSFERKAKEMLLSFRVEKSLSKQEIMSAYLNVVSFGRNTNGQNVAGIEAAARGIFGKHAKDLNIAQSAFLAGLPQNPYTYTPFLTNGSLKSDDELSYGMHRQQYVLARMLQKKKITQQQYDEAKNFNLKQSFKDRVENPADQYPFLVEEVERRAVDIMKYVLAEQDGISKQEIDDTPVLADKYRVKADQSLRNEGYTVDTTINKKIYDVMNDIKNNPNYYSVDRQVDVNGKTETLQHEVGVMLKENKTGKILAFVGGRNHEKSQNNHATQTKRSPGSTMKPLLDYAPAVEYGVITPETVLLDKKFDINGYSPENYAKKEFGEVTARIALENSFNLSTLRLYSGIQNRQPWNFLEKMHIDIPDSEKPNLSLPLGATDITLEDDVNGFSTLANNGNYQESYLIDSIRSKDGKVIYQHKARPERVFSDATSYIMTDILKGVLDTGSAYQLKGTFAYKQDWAGKTGTAQNATDSLFIGYNPSVTMGIWMGYDKPTSFDEENHYQLTLWRDIVNAVTAVSPTQMGVGQHFKQPSSVQTKKICQLTNSLQGSCDGSEPVKPTLVWTNTDLSKKTLKSHAVLSRLGIYLDSKTGDKVSAKRAVANTFFELRGVSTSAGSNTKQETPATITNVSR
ncbi:penicillin-binding protein [Macrococcus equipercicus]|uniref:Penicillin-binding protein n=1 Tax=Macrococcus equipercicus TaxID=69967 RepID=A0ABQ6R7I3_9STAP|nr:transglycosylase domain-containing protein [Macrococcus equipercicus]KAA1038420.1 penicillin-binding protein [Macrococcus equipercicus]